MGERLHQVLGKIGPKLWFPWQQRAPIGLQWRKLCCHFFSAVLIRSFLYLLILMTCMGARRSSKFSQIGPPTAEVAALERRKKSP